ncbi:sulfite oxidase-like protein [Martensiomyces pterosporus]|nr:sulfite oxidase-like protein [Martensiomyces pterosporus]
MASSMPAEAASAQNKTSNVYKDEPWSERTLSNYIVRAKEPFNAEAKLDRLVENFVTPTDRHFRRNHGAIPNLDGPSWQMSIEIASACPSVKQHSVSVGISDLFKLQQFEVVAVLECAGNRRDGLKAIKPVNGVIWGPGTASNAQWGGYRLRDMLVGAGVPANLCDPFYATPRHVEFAGHGDASDDTHYASSIPLEWVMNPLNMVLVATEMNGQKLTRDHGYPARIVAPGIIGARWVKWLKCIRVQDCESENFYQKLDYKILPPMANGANCQEFWPLFPALMELNIQSVICRPTPDECIQTGRPYLVQGYALSGGGRAVDRVEVSLDGGETWDLAKVFSIHAKDRNGQREWAAKSWAWVLWSYRIDSVPPRCEIACRAWDSGGNTQPSNAVWNYRGVMNNSVYHVQPKTAAASRL